MSGNRENRRRIAALVLTAAGMTLAARLVIGDNFMALGSLSGLLGEPSKPTVRAGQVQVARASTRYARRRHTYQNDVTEHHATVNRSWQVAVAKTKSGGTAARPTPTRPVPSAPPAPPVTYQDLTLAFVTPSRSSAAQIPLQARVRDADGRVSTVALRTDANGKARLNRVGPLPATLDLDVTGSGVQFASETVPAGNGGTPGTDAEAIASASANNLRDAAASEPEWRFQSAGDTSRVLAQGQGAARQIVAEADETSAVSPAAVALPSMVAAAPGFGPAHGIGVIVDRLLPLLVGHTAAAPAQTRRSVVYSYTDPQPIVVERTVADVQVSAPSGSKITTPALPGTTVTVPSTGTATVRLPVAALGDGPVPLRVVASLPGGEAETVVTHYGTDPYATNTAAPAPLHLDHLNTCDIKGGVLADSATVAKTYGDSHQTHPLGDGSELWSYPARGVAFKMRKTPTGVVVAERMRLTSPSGGQLPGGVTVGATVGTVQQAMGSPSNIEPASEEAGRFVGEAGDADKAYQYLDGGVVFGVRSSDKTVRWVELVRPTDLLVGGTTAFTPRSPARLYIEHFDGDPHTNLTTPVQLAAYMKQLPSVTLVSRKEDADLILDAKVSQFKEDRSNFLIKAVPFRYACGVELTYSLIDPVAGREIAKDKVASAGAKMDYSKEVAIGAAGLGILAIKGGNVGKIAALGLGAVGVAQLQKVVARAANRCPALASRTVFDQMVGDVNRAADFSARVIAVDYKTGRVTLNVGKNQGVAVSTEEHPYQFEVGVGDSSLPASESGLSADYYTADVVEAKDDSCVCELHHVKRNVRKTDEKFDVTPASDMVRQLPDPATGIVWARAALRFPPVELIPEKPVPGATDTTPDDDTNTKKNVAPDDSDKKPSSDPLSDAIGDLFHKKKK